MRSDIQVFSLIFLQIFITKTEKHDFFFIKKRVNFILILNFGDVTLFLEFTTAQLFRHKLAKFYEMSSSSEFEENLWVDSMSRIF